MTRPKASDVGLPIRPFLYTLDQIATLLEISVKDLKLVHVHFDRTSVGARPIGKMEAHDVNRGVSDTPDWRVSEAELVRWMKYKGFRIYERAWVVR